MCVLRLHQYTLFGVLCTLPFLQCRTTAASNIKQYAVCTSLPLKASIGSSLKYQGFTSANDADCKIEDRQNTEHILGYDMELGRCSQNWWNKLTEVQTGFKDQQYMLDIDEPIRAPYSYNNIEKGLVGNEDEIANSENKFGKYAKNITQEIIASQLFSTYYLI